MHRVRMTCFSLALLALVAAACAPVPLTPPTGSPEAPVTEEPLGEPLKETPPLAPIGTPTRLPTGPIAGGDLPEAVEAAIAIISRTLDAPLADVEVISYEEVTFPDSCLGLGGPDEMCLQALTPGFLIQLEVEGKTYQIHADATGTNVRLNTAPGPRGALPGGNQPIPVLAALRSLSEIAGVPVDQIEIVSVEEVEWPDSCLGLAGEQEVCAEVITPGYQILLRDGEQEYEFHTDNTGENIRRK